jgi:DNA polymerase-1
VVIYTGDSDLRQLVDDRVIVVSPGFRGNDTVYDAKQVEVKHGVPPRLLADLKALSGDTSDGIPGLRGVGPKTAAQLCQAFGTVEHVIEAAQTADGPWPVPARFKPLIASSADDIRLYKKLTTVRADAGVTEIGRKRSRDTLLAHFRAYAFHSLLQPSELHDLMTMGLD